LATDAEYMARALFLAGRGRGRTSPNPMVGALVVDDDGVIVGRGSHEFAGGPHAEIHALEGAGSRARGATLYCTLEPCSHTGRTGPCAPRVADAGIRRVVVAGEDPNPKVAGRGLEHLRERGVAVSIGVMRAEAEALNRPFFAMMQRGRPFVTMKGALSLDARVAAGAGLRTAVTGRAANCVIHRERAEVDAIAVGSETVLVDDPLLTARIAYRHRPLVRVVFDRRLRTPPASRLFSTLADGPVIVITSDGVAVDAARADALERAGAQLERVDASGDSTAFLQAALGRLADRGVSSLVVEGGPRLHAAFWQASLVDRVELFVSPQTLGPGGVDWTAVPSGALAGLRDLTARPIGEDVLIEGYVHRTD
jgi:diaminohydroxyphosphoribosylaminopyrimidine deaminase / 5-amino-6-(5-phosphoribosylamino)uracil reductase